MDQQILQFNVDDIALAPEEVAEALTEATNRGGRIWRVTGLCQAYERVIFCYTAIGDGPGRIHYRIEPFTSTNYDDILGDLDARWQGGFITRGLIQLDNGQSFVGLFEKR